MFDKVLPVIMYALLLAVFVFAAVGTIALASFVLGIFGGTAIELSWLNVLLVALVLRVLMFFVN